MEIYLGINFISKRGFYIEQERSHGSVCESKLGVTISIASSRMLLQMRRGGVPTNTHVKVRPVQAKFKWSEEFMIIPRK
jgi:hypothetical protein